MHARGGLVPIHPALFVAVPCPSLVGLPAQAVGVLQDGGLWRYGGTLTASALEPAHAAAALERWAGHVQTVRARGTALMCTLSATGHALASCQRARLQIPLQPAQAEGSLWRAAALLVAGGQLRAAAAMLREAGAADAACGLTAACRQACAEAGLTNQV